jgi:hypothetical protein
VGSRYREPWPPRGLTLVRKWEPSGNGTRYGRPPQGTGRNAALQTRAEAGSTRQRHYLRPATREPWPERALHSCESWEHAATTLGTAGRPRELAATRPYRHVRKQEVIGTSLGPYCDATQIVVSWPCARARSHSTTRRDHSTNSPASAILAGVTVPRPISSRIPAAYSFHRSVALWNSPEAMASRIGMVREWSIFVKLCTSDYRPGPPGTWRSGRNIAAASRRSWRRMPPSDSVG